MSSSRPAVVRTDKNCNPTSSSSSSDSSEDDEFNWDAMYEDTVPEEDNGPNTHHGSVLSHLLSQVKIGMDFTRVVLPTFILEKRSLLEMYGDFFAHPDMFLSIADQTTPKERIVEVLRWYLGAFHSGRPSDVAKKPYNPILGEIFQCHWNLDDCLLRDGSPDDSSDPACDSRYEQSIIDASGELNIVNNNGTLIPWVCDSNTLVYLGEQVSHHPPISAFYAEHVDKKISVNAHIWTKSKFLGLSICVQNIGNATLTIHGPPKEEYELGFPNAYARSILSVPWVELGGLVTISSEQTGYLARVEFLTKSLFSGGRNKIRAQVFGPEEKKPFLTVEGEWNGKMTGKWEDGQTETFLDVKELKIIKKRTRPMAHQEVFESRNLWKDVTRGLKYKDVDKASDSKFFLEERQRKEAKERIARNETWTPRFFTETGGNWQFKEPLEQRLREMQAKKESSN